MDMVFAKEIINNICNEDVDSIIKAIDFLACNDDFYLIRKIIEQKKFRPELLDNQFYVLLYISRLSNLQDNYRLFSLVAAGHKAMEANNESFCREVIPLLENSFSNVDMLPSGNGIRNSPMHLRYSIYSVLFHIYLYLGDFANFFSTNRNAVSFFQQCDPQSLTVDFYQTCGNVYRCMVVGYLSEFYNRNTDGMVKLYDLAYKSLYLGMVHSDSHQVKFKEYVSYIWSLDILSKFNKSAFLYLNGKVREKPNPDDLIRSIVRNHEENKVSKMIHNFSGFYAAEF